MNYMTMDDKNSDDEDCMSDLSLTDLVLRNDNYEKINDLWIILHADACMYKHSDWPDSE